MGETTRELDARYETLTADEKRRINRERRLAGDNLLRFRLRPGDRLRAMKAECGSREASFIFDHWDGVWIVSKGGASISPGSVYSVNGEVVRL